MPERVALLSTSYPRAADDPAGHFVASEVAALVRTGHEVHVFAPGHGQNTTHGAQLHWLQDRDCFGFPGALARLRERPLRALGAAEFSARAALALRRAGPFDRLVAHFLLPCAWPIATQAHGWPEARFEAVGHGSDVRLFCRLPSRLRAHISQSWLARNVSLRVTSRELAQRLSAASPELSRALRVQASPIDLESAPSRAAARTLLGIAEAERVAVIVARLVPEKRVASALRALSLLPHLRVIVVGEGPERATLAAAFAEVHFAGHVPRSVALRFIAAADVLVSASEHEGAPTVVREARALGVPVVAVEAGDLASWAEQDSGIWLTEIQAHAE